MDIDIRTMIPALPMEDRFATNFLGEIAIAKVVLRALEKRVLLSRPIMEYRYDLVVDDGLKLHRAQVKICRSEAFKKHAREHRSRTEEVAGGWATAAPALHDGRN